ncbi:MAG: hypothetical protein ACJ8GN_08755 [Longimicrobiaceae bacterium]
MRPARRFAAALLVLPLFSGCLYRRTLFNPDASTAGVPTHTFTVIRSVVFFPPAGAQWNLDLRIPSERVRAGEEVTFPSPGVSASYRQVYEGGGYRATPMGRIRFRRVRPDRVQAEVDLRTEGRRPWRLRRTMWFRRSAGEKP